MRFISFIVTRVSQRMSLAEQKHLAYIYKKVRGQEEPVINYIKALKALISTT